MGPVKRGGILWLSEVSQEGLCSTGLFSYPGYFLDKVQKFEKNLNHESSFRERNLNPESPEYKHMH